MSTLSRTAEKCRKCPKVKSCNNKRLEACALAELSRKVSTNLTAPLTKNVAMLVSNKITPITIKVDGDIRTSVEEISKRLAQGLMIDACYFR